MADKQAAEKGITPDWLVRGVLTKVGDIFDRITGRGWRPSSSLATSELIERMKALLDAEARHEPNGVTFVPNKIRLKMQWDKFSTDSEEALRKLENELLTAAVDHINDKRYFTHAPLSIEAKADYFTPGVRLLVSFDRFEDEEREAEIVSAHHGDEAIHESAPPQSTNRTFVATFTVKGEERNRTLNLKHKKRLSVGRSKENDLAIDDASVSKIHASLTVNSDDALVVADTGSTNGTFVAGERISYGKAVIVGNGGVVKFGAVDVTFKPVHIPKPADGFALADTVASENLQQDQTGLDRTQPAIELDKGPDTEEVKAK
jgi:hypothetical protein